MCLLQQGPASRTLLVSFVALLPSGQERDVNVPWGQRLRRLGQPCGLESHRVNCSVPSSGSQCSWEETSHLGLQHVPSALS